MNRVVLASHRCACEAISDPLSGNPWPCHVKVELPCYKAARQGSTRPCFQKSSRRYDMVQVHCMFGCRSADLHPALVVQTQRQYFSAWLVICTWRGGMLCKGCVRTPWPRQLHIYVHISVVEKDTLQARLCMSWSEMIYFTSDYESPPLFSVLTSSLVRRCGEGSAVAVLHCRLLSSSSNCPILTMTVFYLSHMDKVWCA